MVERGLQSKTSGIEDTASKPHTLREKEVTSARFWSGLVACLLRRCLPFWLHLQLTCPMQRETASSVIKVQKMEGIRKCSSKTHALPS